MDPTLALVEIINGSNFYLAAFQLILIGSVFYFLLRRVIPDPFDYAFYVAFTSFFSLVFGLQLYSVNLIDLSAIAWIIFCTLLFYSGFLTGHLVVKQDDTTNKFRASKSNFLYFFIIFLASALPVYFVTGIPLLMETRLTQFSDVGGGFGVLGRILETSRILVIYFLFLYYSDKKINYQFWLIITPCLLTLILSGSKSAILLIAWLGFLTGIIPGFRSMKFKNKLLLAFALVTYPLFIIVIQGGDSFQAAYISLLSRIAYFGDVYAFAYAGNVIDGLKKPDFMALFNPLLETLRLVDKGSTIIPGFEFMGALHPHWELASGPNPRLPVYLDYFYSRYFFIIAFLFGLIFGYASKKIRLNRKSFGKSSILVLLFFAAGSSETDPIIFINSLTNILIFLPCIFVLKLFNKISQYHPQKMKSF